MIRLLVVLVATVALAQATALDPKMGTVLPDDEALTFARARLCSRPAPGRADGTWKPDAETIRQLEAALGRELQGALDLSPQKEQPRLASDYYRQYAPLIVDGKRIIYVNGLHRLAVERNAQLDWMKTAAHPCDGGMMFFGAEYDAGTGRFSQVIFNGGGRGAAPVDQRDSIPPHIAVLFDKAALGGRIHSLCPVNDGFAVATIGGAVARYVILYSDGRAETLATYTHGPDVKCYSLREARQLDATIRESETIEGSVKPQRDSTVVCGFVEPTEAVCWQYSPAERRYVKVGGWRT